MLQKIKETLQFLRYGSTRTRAVEQRAEAMAADYAQQHAAVESVLRALDARLAASERQLQADASSAALAAAELRRTSDEVLRDFDSLRSQLAGLRAALDRVGTSPAGQGTPATTSSAAAAEESFYPMLERHFRGSPDMVKQRLVAYRDWVQRMPPGRVADLGCGRGEWMELVRSWGRDAVGVDSNALVTQELQAKGLAFEQADALAWLQSQPDASLAGVTAFQVVEHLPFGVLLRVLQETERALLPGGVVILETPNPENIDVATRTFWLDPSHVRPLPPQLLGLAAQFCGLREEAVLRVNPPEEGEGAGRDYALVASKARA